MCDGDVATAIIGGDVRGLLYGAGKFLRTSRFDGATPTPLLPSNWTGTDAPRAPGGFRAHYIADHYDNFYQAAPVSNVSTYMEDIALWGVNTIIVELPGPSSFDHGQRTVAPNAPQIAALTNRTLKLLAEARAIGLSPGLIVVPNQGYDAGKGKSPFPYTPFPDPEHVRGNLGALSCAATARNYLIDLNRKLLQQYSSVGIDWIVWWPYDEGGCGCHDDWPWGGKGFPRISTEMTAMAMDMFPTVRTVASTWVFDKPIVNGSEYEGLDAFIKARRRTGNFTFSHVMVDDHGDFPRWPLDVGNGSVGGLQIVNFPEISMWGRSPWGGWGANPLPSRFQGLWNQTEGKVVGGMPYSEGIYEDMNAVVAWQHYWSALPAMDTIQEYIAYEFSSVPRHVSSIVRAITLLDITQKTSGFVPAEGLGTYSTSMLWQKGFWRLV